MSENFEPVPVMVIHDKEAMRVLSDALRGQILELLATKPLTVRQVAEKLGHSPSKLHYHFNLMEKHNLIRVVETRMVANMMEKLYRVTAYNFDFSQDLLTFNTDENRNDTFNVISSLIDITRDDLARSIQARLVELEQGAPEKPREMILNRQVVGLTAEQAEVFRQRVFDLVKDIAEVNDPAAEDESILPYALTIAFYPSFYFKNDATQSASNGKKNK